MAVEILHFGGYIDGDEILDPAAPSYVGGQPCQIGPNGITLCTTELNVFGIFKNNKVEDTGQGPQVADVTTGTGVSVSTTYISGGNKVRMYQGVGTVTGSADANPPFAFPPSGGGGTWHVNDQIFVSAAGLWDNAPAIGGDRPQGRVTKAPANALDDLIAVLYSLKSHP